MDSLKNSSSNTDHQTQLDVNACAELTFK